jgi:hypothetical protein
MDMVIAKASITQFEAYLRDHGFIVPEKSVYVQVKQLYIYIVARFGNKTGQRQSP